MNEPYKHAAITELILKAFYVVYNTLGYGFLEKVYANALLIELGHWLQGPAGFVKSNTSSNREVGQEAAQQAGFP